MITQNKALAEGYLKPSAEIFISTDKIAFSNIRKRLKMRIRFADLLKKQKIFKNFKKTLDYSQKLVYTYNT